MTANQLVKYKPRRKILREFFLRPTPIVARDLIGCIIEHVIADEDVRSLRLVETEAYLAEHDAACHASTSRTKRNEPMFDRGGGMYVYLIYGIHHCANIVTEGADRGCAVLLRAGEVIDRGRYAYEAPTSASSKTHTELRIASGPGKLAKFMAFTPAHNHASVCDGALNVYEDALTAEYRQRIVTTTRIGITKDADLPLRYYDGSSAAVSRK